VELDPYFFSGKALSVTRGFLEKVEKIFSKFFFVYQKNTERKKLKSVWLLAVGCVCTGSTVFRCI
jgi:hypothetical protein